MKAFLILLLVVVSVPVLSQDVLTAQEELAIIEEMRLVLEVSKRTEWTAALSAEVRAIMAEEGILVNPRSPVALMLEKARAEFDLEKESKILYGWLNWRKANLTDPG